MSTYEERRKSRVVLPLSVCPVNYKIQLEPNLTTLTFAGDLTIDVNVSEQTSEVALHAKELVIKSVSYQSVDGLVNDSIKLTDINYNLVLHTVTFKFSQDFPLGNGRIHVLYDGILNGDMAGFYKSSYTDADGKKQVMASTQFEALDARRYMSYSNYF